MPNDPVLTVAEMRAAEDMAIARGIDAYELMRRAGEGAADWVHRLAPGGSVSILAGKGNNGGDGYVIARALRDRGAAVTLIAPDRPSTDAARKARSDWGGPVRTEPDALARDVFVDCLLGSGLSRPLGQDDLGLLQAMSRGHSRSVAIDLPSGVSADDGAWPDGLPAYDVTLALGAWKRAHFLLPARGRMGRQRLVPIGLSFQRAAGYRIARPRLSAPPIDAHKYTRGLVALVGGAMPGAILLAARGAANAGAGYVKLVGAIPRTVPPSFVADDGSLADVLGDERIGALCIGPGLGQDDAARERLEAAIAADRALVLDGDALRLLRSGDTGSRDAALVATPHAGELKTLSGTFGVEVADRVDRLRELSRTSGMVVVGKGPDTVVAGPDGRLAFADRATSWLSVAGSGDVLAGILTSRLAAGAEPFDAACEAVWLHAEAGRIAPAPFTAATLAHGVAAAVRACME